jgi:hypothetical protein
MINETSIVEVADYFGVTKEWSFNTVYKDDDNAHDILEDILKHTRGSLIYSAGAYYLKYADTNYNPVELDLLYEDDDKTDAERGDYALFDDDSIEIVSPSRFDRANRGIVAWIDASRKDTKDELRLFNEAEYLRDGDYRDHKIELLGCTDKDMAIQLGNYYLERAILFV